MPMNSSSIQKVFWGQGMPVVVFLGLSQSQKSWRWLEVTDSHRFTLRVTSGHAQEAFWRHWEACVSSTGKSGLSSLWLLGECGLQISPSIVWSCSPMDFFIYQSDTEGSLHVHLLHLWLFLAKLPSVLRSGWCSVKDICQSHLTNHSPRFLIQPC